jgi:hypothetical protein
MISKLTEIISAVILVSQVFCSAIVAKKERKEKSCTWLMASNKLHKIILRSNLSLCRLNAKNNQNYYDLFSDNVPYNMKDTRCFVHNHL